MALLHRLLENRAVTTGYVVAVLTLVLILQLIEVAT